MALKGQEKIKFDEFSIIILGAIIFLGILLLAFNTPAEFPPKVVPDSFTFELGPGDVQAFSINITGGISGANVTTSGEVGRWITVPQQELGALRQNTVITMTLSVPATATIGTHRGQVIVKGRGGQFEVDVTVVVTAIQRLSSRPMTMGDFTVRYLSGTSVLDTVESGTAARSYFGERRVNLVGIVDEEIAPLASSASLRFVVEDTNNYGPLIVTQNGVDVFKEVVGPGEVVVPLNASDIRRSNTVSIRSDTPGIFFWAENVYAVRDAELEVSFDGSVPKTFNFTILPEEATRFDHFQLTFVGDALTESLPPMKITINGQTVYAAVPPSGLFNQNFAKDSFGRILTLGDVNSIVFSFDQSGSLQVNNAVLTLFTRA